MPADQNNLHENINKTHVNLKGTLSVSYDNQTDQIKTQQDPNRPELLDETRFSVSQGQIQNQYQNHLVSVPHHS